MATIHNSQAGAANERKHIYSQGHAHTTDPRSVEPLQRLDWQDPITGARAYLIFHTRVSGLATGGTRMRVGCSPHEVADLARAMALKTGAFGLPVGGAKAGIDFDPKDPRASGVLERFYAFVRPWLDDSWVTAEDLGVSQQTLDDVFAGLGMDQTFHAAIRRSTHPELTLERVRRGLAAETEDGQPIADIIGGYGVAEACLGAADAWGWAPTATAVAIQGVGTMGGGAAWYLHQAGMRVIAIADALGTLYDYQGLDIPALLELRNGYGEIDRARVPESVTQLPREAIFDTDAEIFVPAAMSYAIQPDNEHDVSAMVVVEAANAATIPQAEEMLAARGVPVIPDFVANAGSAAWAWWLLQGQVGTDPQDSFDRLRTEMRSKVALMLREWDAHGTRPRDTALDFAAANAQAVADQGIAIP